MGHTVSGHILMASGNSKSLMLSFEAILDGHVAMMPVLMGGDGAYYSLVTGNMVTIKGETKA
jgi:hypothetical protein